MKETKSSNMQLEGKAVVCYHHPDKSLGCDRTDRFGLEGIHKDWKCAMEPERFLDMLIRDGYGLLDQRGPEDPYGLLDESGPTRHIIVKAAVDREVCCPSCGWTDLPLYAVEPPHEDFHYACAMCLLFSVVEGNIRVASPDGRGGLGDYA